MKANFPISVSFSRFLATSRAVLLLLLTVVPVFGQDSSPKQLLNSGIGFTNTARYDSAAIYLNRAFTAYNSSNDKHGAGQALSALGNLSFKRKKLPQARDFYNQALDYATKSRSFAVMVESYNGLANVYESQKDLKKAIANMRLMQAAYDSMVTDSHRRKIDTLENKYTAMVREKDSLLVVAEAQQGLVKTDRLLKLIERDDIRLTFYSVTLALTAVLIFFFGAWLYTRQRARSAELKLRHERDATRLSNEQFEVISQNVRDELANGTHNTLDTIWLINPNNRSLESLIVYIREQINALVTQAGVNYMIIVPDRIPNVQLSGLERLNLFVVTREMVSHLLKCSKATGLTVSITLEGKQLIFKVKDNSPVDDAKLQKRADELKPYREKMEQINGTIGVVTEQGAMVVVYRKDL